MDVGETRNSFADDIGPKDRLVAAAVLNRAAKVKLPLDRFLAHAELDQGGSIFTPMVGKSLPELTPPQIKQIAVRGHVLGGGALLTRRADEALSSTDKETLALTETSMVLALRRVYIYADLNDLQFQTGAWPASDGDDGLKIMAIVGKLNTWFAKYCQVPPVRDAKPLQYQAVMKMILDMSGPARADFLCALCDQAVMGVDKLTAKFAAFPYYVARLALEDPGCSHYDKAVHYLRCNQAYAGLLMAQSDEPVARMPEPSWWHRRICETATYAVTNKQRDAAKKQGRRNGLEPPPEAEATTSLLLLELKCAMYGLLVHDAAQWSLAWSLLAEAADRTFAPHASLSASVACVDPSFRRLPEEVMHELAEALRAYQAFPQLHVEAPDVFTALSRLYASANEIDSESKAGGELQSRVIYLCVNDRAIIELAQTARSLVAQLEPHLCALRNAAELVSQEKAAVSGLGRKARRTAIKRLKFQASNAESATKSAEPDAPSPWADVLAPIASAPVRSTAMGQDNAAAPKTHVAAVSPPKSPQPAQLLHMFDALAVAVPGAPVATVELGGVALPTRLAGSQLVKLLGFVGPSTFERVAWIKLRSTYDVNCSAAAYSLQWHLNKHFSSWDSQSGRLAYRLTAEEFIRGALQVAVSSQNNHYFVASAANAGQKVRKYLVGGYFAILGLDYSVITYGRDEGGRFASSHGGQDIAA
jgi:hypothetical protein